MTKKKLKPKAKKLLGRKSWLKVAKKVHELNKKNNLGWTWVESMQFASKKVYPKFKILPHHKIKISDITEEFNKSKDGGTTPLPLPVPKEKEICSSAKDIILEDLVETDWWFIDEPEIWNRFDDNVPMRFAFDGIIDTGIIKKKNMPDTKEIREAIRRQKGEKAHTSNEQDVKIVFTVLVQPNKKDDNHPCSYYVLVTLENSSYDLSVGSEKEIIPVKSEKDLPKEEQQKREQFKIDKAKQKRSKQEAKKLNRPKQVEPKAITKLKDQPEENSKDLNNQNEIQKIKLQKENREVLERVLDGLRQDFKDGILTKRQYLQRQKIILDKFEYGGRI